MKAFAIHRYGGPQRLALRDLPEPEPGPGDLLIATRAASVNPVDFKIRSGGLKMLVKDRFPLVRKNRIGAFVERVLVDAAVAARKPSNLTHAEAASVPLVGETSFQALVEIGKLKMGQRALIHAGSGGIGTFAIQLARHLGATVATTAGAKNRALVERLRPARAPSPHPSGRWSQAFCRPRSGASSCTPRPGLPR
jgi:alcohol dehydrogenase